MSSSCYFIIYFFLSFFFIYINIYIGSRHFHKLEPLLGSWSWRRECFPRRSEGFLVHSWISSKNWSIKEMVMLAVKKIFVFFFCYSLLVDLYLLIVPKLRSAFLELQFCRPWASNFCCNLSSSFFHAICEERWNRTWPPSTPGNFFPFFRIRRNFDNFIYFFIKRRKRMNVGDVFNNSLNFLILRQTIFLGAGAICPCLSSVNADARRPLRVFSVPRWNCRGGLLYTFIMLLCLV